MSSIMVISNYNRPDVIKYVAKHLMSVTTTGMAMVELLTHYFTWMSKTKIITIIGYFYFCPANERTESDFVRIEV